jgi:hypothetical protein
MNCRFFDSRGLVATAALLATALPVPLARGSEILPPGFRPKPVGVHALVGGRVVVKPGATLDGATIVIRDGYFEAVGKDVTIPADARAWDVSGLTIYAGFIEPYLPLGQTNQPIATGDSEPVNSSTLAAGGVNFFGAPGQRTDAGPSGPGHEIAKITPEFRAVRNYTPDPKTLQPLRELGFTTAVVAPARGIVRGTSALVSLAEQDPNEAVLKSEVFQHIAFETHEQDEKAYPGSLMGAIAAVRQSCFDAQHYALDQADWQQRPQGRKRPEFNPSLEALLPAAEGKQRVLFEPGSALMVDRAARVARELKLDFAIVSCGQEWRRPDLAKETGATFIVPVNFPSLPKLPSEDDWEQVTLDQLRAWDWAAENPALLRQQKLDIALTTYSLADKKVFRKNVKAALDRGLSETDALAALTTIPAKLCGVGQQLGTIEPGKIANLTIVDGKGYFDPEARVREVWVDGRNYHVQPAKEEAKTDESTDKEKEAKAKAEKEKKEAELKELQNRRVARSPVEGRGPLAAADTIVLAGGTVWTWGKTGILTNAEVRIAAGKIVSVSQSARPQLAGGLTVANLLHGSANPIGAQNCVIKLRDGASPEGLKFEDAPAGIKFALGENVKQSNWGEKFTTRFPQSRTGVPTFYRNRFTAAQQYLGEWFRWRVGGNMTVSPRRDLELEAIGEIIQSNRLIHCHSYRQDEILAFLRVMEEFKVRVGTLQHVLEGYKVADEIAKHGAGASCFSDWWAYKFEVARGESRLGVAAGGAGQWHFAFRADPARRGGRRAIRVAGLGRLDHGADGAEEIRRAPRLLARREPRHDTQGAGARSEEMETARGPGQGAARETPATGRFLCRSQSVREGKEEHRDFSSCPCVGGDASRGARRSARHGSRRRRATDSRGGGVGRDEWRADDSRRRPGRVARGGLAGDEPHSGDFQPRLQPAATRDGWLCGQLPRAGRAASGGRESAVQRQQRLVGEKSALHGGAGGGVWPARGRGAEGTDALSGAACRRGGSAGFD